MARPLFKNPLANSDLSPAHKKICKRFREVRLKEGLSQGEYAARLGVNVSSVKAVETGKFLPSLDTLKALKKQFGVNYSYMLDGKD